MWMEMRQELKKVQAQGEKNETLHVNTRQLNIFIHLQET
jgi:hypothetical protein